VKPRIRRQRRGWVLEQDVLLIGINTAFRKTLRLRISMGSTRAGTRLSSCD
jgi:hypothetical protein